MTPSKVLKRILDLKYQLMRNNYRRTPEFSEELEHLWVLRRERVLELNRAKNKI